MDSLERVFATLFLSMSLLAAFIFVNDLSDKLAAKAKIDKFVFDHDCYIALCEDWACYLDGNLVDLKGLDLSSSFYVVKFDYYNKVVVVTRKNTDISFPRVIFTKNI